MFPDLGDHIPDAHARGHERLRLLVDLLHHDAPVVVDLDREARAGLGRDVHLVRLVFLPLLLLLVIGLGLLLDFLFRIGYGATLARPLFLAVSPGFRPFHLRSLALVHWDSMLHLQLPNLGLQLRDLPPRSMSPRQRNTLCRTAGAGRMQLPSWIHPPAAADSATMRRGNARGTPE